MILEAQLHVYLVGFFGGFAAEVLRWYELRTTDKLPKYVKSPFYWFVSVLMAFISGIVPVFYGLNSAIVVFHIGVSTPIILKQMALSAPRHRP